jgi:hypothetical protein
MVLGLSQIVKHQNLLVFLITGFVLVKLMNIYMIVSSMTLVRKLKHCNVSISCKGFLTQELQVQGRVVFSEEGSLDRTHQMFTDLG